MVARGAIMTKGIEKKPTADELAGMAWWNGMPEAERKRALAAAGTAIAAEAWMRHSNIERWAAFATKALRPRKRRGRWR
jgi:hypothetical protein